MKNVDAPQTLMTKRERQIMDTIYRMEHATAAEIQEALSDAPSYSAVRALLAIMERKGLVRHNKQGAKFVYEPVSQTQMAAQSAAKHLLSTFFGGSLEKAVSTLLSVKEADVSDEELENLSQMIRKARESEKGE